MINISLYINEAVEDWQKEVFKSLRASYSATVPDLIADLDYHYDVNANDMKNMKFATIKQFAKELSHTDYYKCHGPNFDEEIKELYEEWLKTWLRNNKYEKVLEGDESNGHWVEYVDDDTGEIIKYWEEDKPHDYTIDADNDDAEYWEEYERRREKAASLKDDYLTVLDEINTIRQELDDISFNIKQLYIDQEEEIGQLFSQGKHEEGEELAQKYGEDLDKLLNQKKILNKKLTVLNKKINDIEEKIDAIMGDYGW